MALLPSSIVSILIAFLFFSLSLSQEAELVVPVPQGPYAVGQKIAKLVNSSLQGSNIAEHEPRDVLISLFYPIQQSACKKLCVVPYMPPRTADFVGLGVDDVKIQICCETPEKAAKDVTKLPLVLFSPGLGATRLIYNAMAMDLAGAGYSVATIDHPIDTPIVEYPDGSYTMGLNSTYWDTATEEDFIKALDDRVTDARFVLAQLGQAEVVKELVPGAEGAYDVCHTGFYGHSFGGATALQTMMRDSRIAGGINIDGTQFGPVFNTTSPGVLFGRADPSPHNISSDASWPGAWDALKGWKRELGLKQSRHITFSDLPYYVKLSNISLDQKIDTLFGAPQNITIRDVVGDLDGGRSFTVVTTYVRAFMDFVLKGRETKLFEAAGAVPEIVVGETGE